MKGKNYLSIIIKLIIIAVLAFFVLSDKVIVIDFSKDNKQEIQQSVKTNQEEDLENQEESKEVDGEKDNINQPKSEVMPEEATVNTETKVVSENEEEVKNEETNEIKKENVEKKDIEKKEVKSKKSFFERFKHIEIKNGLSYQNINLGLDLKGGASILYQADKKFENKQEMNRAMDSAIALLRKRLDSKGYTEGEVSKQGEDRIRLEIPGMTSAEQALEEIGKTAEVKFYGITTEDLQKVSKETEETAKKFADFDMQKMQNIPENQKEQFKAYMAAARYQQLLPKAIQGKGELVVQGTEVERATLGFRNNEYGTQSEPIVVLKLNNDGKKKFADATKKYLNNYIVIMLDNEILTKPTVSTEILNGEAIINGYAGREDEARNIAELINSGSLPFNLVAMQTNIVEARLGTDSLAKSIKAGVIGFALVLVYMLLIYKIPGFLADIALVGYVSLVMCGLALFNVTLTLPGIAGIILSIGMAVDANVIIFTRIKEELNLQKTARAAITSGFSKAMSAIIDGNITTLIIAAILFWKGAGPIKGFAQTLGIGIFISMFTALFVTKKLLMNFVNIGVTNPVLYGGKSKNIKVSDLNSK